MTLAHGTAGARIDTACRLLAVLPATHALWESGRIDAPKARAIDEATRALSDELAAAVEARVLPNAAEQTLAQLKAALARAILAVDPEGADARHKRARRGRRVVLQEEAEGMALARGLGADDPRTMDARRADLLAALLNGRLVADPDGAPDDEDPGDGTAHDATGRPRPRTAVLRRPIR